MIQFRLRGLERIQAANRKLLLGISAKYGLAAGVKTATIILHNYAVGITHVQTGTLQRSHLTDFASGGVQTFRFGFPIMNRAIGRIYINPAARNPVTGQRPEEYGLLEHRKGGSHAFYRRTVDERGKYAAGIAIRQIKAGLPRGQTFSAGIALRIPGTA